MIGKIIKNSIDNPIDYIVGFADLNGMDLPFRYGIVIGKRLDDNIIDAIDKGPTLECYDYYYTINSTLSALVHEIEKQLVDLGYECRVVKPSNNGQDSNDENYRKR